MPQVDLSSVCAAEEDETQPQPQLDYAPESFWLSKDAELDWLDRNAFMERKDSGKSHSTNLNSTAASTRYSGTTKSKPSIIGLPKPSKPNYAEAKNRRQCKPGSIRLFPKRSGSSGNKGMSEPTSPKVSCMGRVRSKKERKKNRKKVKESVKESRPGFWNNFRFMFKSKMDEKGESSAVGTTQPQCNSIQKRGCVEAPGLGGVHRFASGRRSDAWAADLQSLPVDVGVAPGPASV